MGVRRWGWPAVCFCGGSHTGWASRLAGGGGGIGGVAVAAGAVGAGVAAGGVAMPFAPASQQALAYIGPQGYYEDEGEVDGYGVAMDGRGNRVMGNPTPLLPLSAPVYSPYPPLSCPQLPWAMRTTVTLLITDMATVMLVTVTPATVTRRRAGKRGTGRGTMANASPRACMSDTCRWTIRGT
ncbi:hypothetical protein CLOM_g16087 [Closterium sp. NIES-68]|nr:hypothetical protein CLOM_g16087 [Closterium sp. NIES-68]